MNCEHQTLCHEDPSNGDIAIIEHYLDIFWIDMEMLAIQRAPWVTHGPARGRGPTFFVGPWIFGQKNVARGWPMGGPRVAHGWPMG